MKRKPLVAFVTPGTFSMPSERQSSVERIVGSVAPHLLPDFRVCVFSRRGAGLATKQTVRGVLHIRPSAGKGGKRYALRTLRWLRRLDPAMIQVENRPRLAGWIKRRMRHKRVWLSLHSLTFVTRPHIAPAELRRCLADVDRIVVNSEFLRSQIAALAPAASHKIVVNYPGVDERRFTSRWSPEGEERRRRLLDRLGYRDKRIVLYAGRLIEIKGVHHLLSAVPDIAAAFPDTVVVVVGSAFYGSGKPTPYVRRLHREGGKYPQHVRFVPYVGHDELPDWYKLADVVVVPSFEREAFGLVNAEAMASGVPVVATDAGGIREIVMHGETGLLLPPEELPTALPSAICRLLGDPDEARRMGEAGWRRVCSLFTWRHCARRLAELYRQPDERRRR